MSSHRLLKDMQFSHIYICHANVDFSDDIVDRGSDAFYLCNGFFRF